jgi:hypothetical protein
MGEDGEVLGNGEDREAGEIEETYQQVCVLLCLCVCV